MLDRYLEFKVFELFRDRLVGIVNTYDKSLKAKEMIYNHLFLAPNQYSKVRSFQVNGVQFPYVALWATSPLNYNTGIYYGRSCLPHDFKYFVKASDGTQVTKVARCHVYDYKKTFQFTAGAYFLDFISDVNQNLLELDRLRYFEVDMSELLPGYKSVIEVKRNGATKQDSVDSTSNQGRSFILTGEYEVSATFPVPMDFDYIEHIKLYVENHLIYQK